MKITKRQLRRIIKEERRTLLKEARMANSRGCFSPMKSRAHPEFAARIKEARGDVGDFPRDAADWLETLGQLIDQDLTSRGVWYEEEGLAIIDALEQLRLEIRDTMRGPTR